MVQTDRHGTWIWLGKVFLASVIAFTALSLFCIVYYRMPSHHPCGNGSTDYVWGPYFNYSLAYEGFGRGKTNNEGRTSEIDYTTGMPIDVLVMGSSHMEGLQVPLRDVTANRLNRMCSDATVYNIGMQKHDFLTCAGNIQAAVEHYQPEQFVILETHTLLFPESDIRNVLEGSQENMQSYSGILGLLQHDPYLRLVYRQLTGFAEKASNGSAPGHASDHTLLDSLLSQMSDTVASSGAKLIIVYHPATILQEDGSIEFDTAQDEEDAFAALCEKNGIYFLSMRDRFQQEYDEDHILPYGFANTSVGSGHLNRYGHEMMAEELYTLMQEVGA